MILDEKLEKAYERFCELRSRVLPIQAFKETVRDLMVEKPEDIVEVSINIEKSICGNCAESYLAIPDPKWDLCPTCFDLPVGHKKDGSFGFVEKPEEPEKVKTPESLPYIEANGVKYYPESEEHKRKYNLNNFSTVSLISGWAKMGLTVDEIHLQLKEKGIN